MAHYKLYANFTKSRQIKTSFFRSKKLLNRVINCSTAFLFLMKPGRKINCKTKIKFGKNFRKSNFVKIKNKKILPQKNKK